MRDHTKLIASQIEYLRFLEIAYGSLKELHYQFSLASRLGYVGEIEISKYELKSIETEKSAWGVDSGYTEFLKVFSLQSK